MLCEYHKEKEVHHHTNCIICDQPLDMFWADYIAGIASCPKANCSGSAPLFKTHFSPLIHFKFNFQNNQLNTP